MRPTRQKFYVRFPLTAVDCMILRRLEDCGKSRIVTWDGVVGKNKQIFVVTVFSKDQLQNWLINTKDVTTGKVFECHDEREV